MENEQQRRVSTNVALMKTMLQCTSAVSFYNDWVAIDHGQKTKVEGITCVLYNNGTIVIQPERPGHVVYDTMMAMKSEIDNMPKFTKIAMNEMCNKIQRLKDKLHKMEEDD